MLRPITIVGSRARPDKDIGITGDGLNYFSYDHKQEPALPGDTAPEAADPEGVLCPIGAHIRKVKSMKIQRSDRVANCLMSQAW
jgi:hypothetical protein